MISEEEVRKALQELKRAQQLYKDFLTEKELHKKGEHLWGAINNLASGLYRLRTGRGPGKHSDVMKFLSEIVRSIPGLEEEDVRATSLLHANFYHDFLNREDFEVYSNHAKRLYDCLVWIFNEELTHILKGELKELS